MRPAIPDIVEEHFEELAFLAIRRRALLFSATATPRQLARHDARIAAHRDGLRIAGGVAIDLAVGVLDDGDDPWSVAAAACTWLDLARPASAEIAQRFTSLPPELLSAWREAVRWCAHPAALSALGALSGCDDPRTRHLALEADAWHGGLDPTRARTATADPDAAVRWTVARHAGHALARDAALPLLEALLDDCDDAVRAAALWSLALHHSDQAIVRAQRSNLPVGLRILGLFGDDTVVPLLAEAAADDHTLATACAALADQGGRAAIIALATHIDQVPAQAALAMVLGTVPETAAAADTAWLAAAGPLSGAEARVRGGVRQPAADPANEARWRAAIRAPTADTRLLARDLPDGLLAGAPRDDAVTGT